MAIATTVPSIGHDALDGIRLAPLRDDLVLLPAPPAPDGSPCWTIHDPIRNRFFRIGHAAFEVLARWHLASPAAIARSVAAETLLDPAPEDILELARFLSANALSVATDEAALLRQATHRVSWWWWLVHNYLFFRIPLVRPDRFLGATLRWAAPFHTRAWWAAVLVAGLAGLWLASRQWESFAHTFLHFFSPEGFVLYGVTLTVTKTLHELGHAYTAKRHGCRVPTMGVAFLVLWPVLYTDTTDAWRLVSRRARLEVAGAGVLTELALAALATLAWSFLPDGPVRSAAFFLATVSWVTTLAINLGPFMRFDGYYLLADALDVPNLQPRAFALARWRLRELLFGLGEPPPEEPGRRLALIMLAYAYATWIYRLVLFTGIALLVYHIFTKVLGIVLFGIEIGWFIVKPVKDELAAWWKARRRMRVNGHALASLGGASLLAGLAVMPMGAGVPVPAVWRAQAVAALYAPLPARVAEVHLNPGRTVAAGDLLVRLETPELESRLEQATLRADLLQGQIARLAASREKLERLHVLEEDLAGVLAERQGLLDGRARLEVRAPFAGVVVDVEEALIPGRWVNPRLALGTVVVPGAGELVGYVGEADLERVKPGAAAVFHSDDPAAPGVNAVVKAVDRMSTAALDIPSLASVHGGPVAVESLPGATAGRAALVPVEGAYRVTLVPADASATAPARVERGVARVEAETRSLADRLWRTALAVLIREAGF